MFIFFCLLSLLSWRENIFRETFSLFSPFLMSDVALEVDGEGVLTSSPFFRLEVYSFVPFCIYELT